MDYFLRNIHALVSVLSRTGLGQNLSFAGSVSIHSALLGISGNYLDGSKVLSVLGLSIQYLPNDKTKSEPASIVTHCTHTMVRSVARSLNFMNIHEVRNANAESP